MSSVPQLNLAFLQQLAIFTSGLKAGLPSDTLIQGLKEQAEALPAEEASLLRQMGEDLRALQAVKPTASADVPSLLRELTRAVDHQIRNAHVVATASLQTGEMDLEGVAVVLSAMGDTQGLLALEEVRTRMRIAREGLLRASAFLDVLGTLTAGTETGEDFDGSVRRKIAELMTWRPDILSTPQPAPLPAVSGPGRHILYVEDDVDAGEMIEMFMDRLDFVERVHRCASFAGALRVFSENPKISTLVTDYHLEGAETGLDLARELRRRQPGLRTLVTSGSIEELKECLTREEKRDFVLIAKPFDLVDLEASLREAANLGQ